MPRLLLMALILPIAACTPALQPVVEVGEGADAPAWRSAIRPADAERIGMLPTIWSLARATLTVRQKALAQREGDLLDPDAARDHPAIPPGSYRCRLVRIDGTDRRKEQVRSFKEFYCYIRGERDNRLSFTKQTGSELPGGWLHPDGERRLVMVGAMQREQGDNSLNYGDEPERDLVGVVERIGPFRWRLVLPPKRTEPRLDIYELTPVPAEEQVPEPRAPAE